MPLASRLAAGGAGASGNSPYPAPLQPGVGQQQQPGYPPSGQQAYNRPPPPPGQQSSQYPGQSSATSHTPPAALSSPTDRMTIATFVRYIFTFVGVIAKERELTRASTGTAAAIRCPTAQPTARPTAIWRRSRIRGSTERCARRRCSWLSARNSSEPSRKSTCKSSMAPVLEVPQRLPQMAARAVQGIERLCQEWHIPREIANEHHPIGSLRCDHLR